MALGTLADLCTGLSDKEIVVFVAKAAELNISDDNLINKDRHDHEFGSCHLARRSGRL